MESQRPQGAGYHSYRYTPQIGVKEGDKILFVEEAGKVYILNASMEALRKAQAAFAGEAERVGLKDENDVVTTIKELRRER